jgi:hypothetical protein
MENYLLHENFEKTTIMFVPRKFYYVEKVPLGTILI